MGRGLQPLVSWIATGLMLLSLAPAAGVAAPFTSYQFRPLPGDDAGRRPPGQPGAFAPGSGYPAVAPSPQQPRYRFRERSGDRPSRYSMPGYRLQPGVEGGDVTGPARPRPPVAGQPIPGYRFRPGGERDQKRKNR